ncbi:MAG: nuclear transport factor 2 family protein [Saprospiraceae bacterium]
MKNQELIEKFYQSFVDGNAEGMIMCYHDDIEFEDPAFGKLKGDKAKAMWQMLLSRKDASPQIQFSGVKANEKTGSATWIAEYEYGKQKRKVINHISAKFEFADGKIIRHTDDFDLWKWSRQALGFSGLLLGWSSFMRNKIQATTNGLLRKYMEK